jgi:hypothetical protein
MSEGQRIHPLTGEAMPPRDSLPSEAAAQTEPGNPFAQSLLFISIGLMVLGLIVFVAGLGTEATYENPTGGAGAVMVGTGMLGMGWMLFVAWLATSSVNWQLRAQLRKMTSDAD